jgi:hypothetical protein
MKTYDSQTGKEKEKKKKVNSSTMVLEVMSVLEVVE